MLNDENQKRCVEWHETDRSRSFSAVRPRSGRSTQTMVSYSTASDFPTRLSPLSTCPYMSKCLLMGFLTSQLQAVQRKQESAGEKADTATAVQGHAAVYSTF